MCTLFIFCVFQMCLQAQALPPAMLTNGNIQDAVQLWCKNKSDAVVRFGPIAAWDLFEVCTHGILLSTIHKGRSKRANMAKHCKRAKMPFAVYCVSNVRCSLCSAAVERSIWIARQV